MKKKTFATILALMLCTLGSAQHIVRIDTSIVPYIQFDYQAWLDENPNNRLSPYWGHHQFYRGSPQIPFGREPVRSNCLYGDQIQYNYIEGGANVHGIAVFSLAHDRDVYALDHGDSTTDWYPVDDVYLYDAMPDTLLLLEQKPISRFAPYGPPLQYMFRNHPLGWATRCDSAFNDLYTGRQFLHSLYNPNYILFDKPVHVEDSFYVGTSQKLPELVHYISWCNINGEHGSTMPNKTTEWWARFVIGADGRIDSNCYPPPIKIKQRWTQPEWLENWWIARDSLCSLEHILPEGYVRNRWINRYMIDFTLILPLIETYDTLWDYELVTCPQVEWFNVTGSRGDTTTLRWQSADDQHTEWQLSYGPKGIDPDNGTLVDCRAASWRHIDSLHTRDSMSAWVRTVCRDEDYLRYSDWSHEVSWGGRDSTVLWTEQPQGNIRQEGLVRLTPNPATDEVTIASVYRLSGVEVYSMDGRLRYQAPAQGLTCRFAVQGWTRGTYLVLVQTAAGTSTKKLVVNP